jgi:hypothetical protein|tara:strand:- start:2751 stop:3089 length:339 start_codon:yes stop_codon:yes gene_type:complete
MSDFFDSDIVKDEMETINEMQEEIYSQVFKFPELHLDDQIEHLDMLDDLLERQQVLYTRMKLSDDPRAKEIAQNVRDSAIVMGFPKDVDCNILFQNMRKTLEKVREGLPEKQ